jgi:hypothetical protein
MAYEQEDFKFPDEQDQSPDLDIEIEIEDDTPEEDRGRQPMPKEIADDLDRDELEEYDEGVKQKLKQLKKVWHDERRAKEQLAREQEEALSVARKLYAENQKLRSAYATGEKEYITTAQSNAQMEMDAAKRAYREAYESGDTDGVISAQEKMNLAQLNLIRANNLKETPLQEPEDIVQSQREESRAVQPQVVQPDQKAQAWQERNKWFGQDEEMTAAALGLHTKLVNSGVEAGSDEYYSTLDKTMRKRFSEHFGEPKAKPNTVVAPATRSTASNKIRLSTSQVQLAKKLGLTPEIYARELMKLEKR